MKNPSQISEDTLLQHMCVKFKLIPVKTVGLDTLFVKHGRVIFYRYNDGVNVSELWLEDVDEFMVRLSQHTNKRNQCAL